MLTLFNGEQMILLAPPTMYEHVCSVQSMVQFKMGPVPDQLQDRSELSALIKDFANYHQLRTDWLR